MRSRPTDGTRARAGRRAAAAATVTQTNKKPPKKFN